MSIKDPENQKKLNQFLIEHAPLINYHAKSLQKRGLVPGIEPDDLHAAGFHGLMEALHRYNPDIGAKFSTYAKTRIEGKMLDLAAAADPVPKQARLQAKNLKALENQQPAQTPAPKIPEDPQDQ